MNFDEAIDYVLSEEGGFTDDPDDDGNWTGGQKNKGLLKGTKWGISAASYPDLDIKNLTREDAKKIYKRDYWGKAKVDLLPTQIRLHYFDVCVNSGQSRAVKILQRAAGGLKVDGDLGALTLSASKRVNVWKYARERSDFYVNHVKLNPTKIKYLAGWEGRVLSITEVSLRSMPALLEAIG